VTDVNTQTPAAAPSPSSREGRTPWTDRWILDAMRQQGHTVADRVQSAETAWEAVISAGATPKEVLDVVCSVTGCDPIDIGGVGAGAAKLLSAVHAKRYGVIPVKRVGPVLFVATPNPLVAHLERDLAFATGAQVQIGVVSPQQFRDARERLYGVARATIQVRVQRIEWISKDPTATPGATNRGGVVDALDHIVADALDQRASDIHFEPKELDLLVRFRVDGVLHDAKRVSAQLAPLLLSRIKILSGLDIADRRRPQDGRASARFDGRTVDLRVSTLPMGDRFEKAVVRILDGQSATFGLHGLGFTPAESHRVHQLLDQREGMVLVTGPTGCGKTTTLYSAIEHRRSDATNIVTVEDPIEYDLDGINQVQVNERAGLGFAAALRSILRQDPDVILVGEIRDAETAQIAIKAGMTGHLVLSTLHTMDAPSAIARLADIGADMGALSGALKGVIAQRLVRRLCEACARSVELSELPMNQQMLLMGRKTSQLRLPVGCDACRGTGFRGRMVVPEVLVVGEEMQEAIARRAERAQLMAIAKRGGLQTMWDTGLRRVLEGQTSLGELLDNVASPMAEERSSQDSVDEIISRLTGESGVPASVAPVAPAVPESASAPRPLAAVLSVVPGGTESSSAPVPRRRPPLPDDAPRVLLVHDDRLTRVALRDALEEQGCAVIEAADGEAGLRYARQLHPVAVVTELVLPRLDGIGLIQAVMGELAIPAFVFTAQRDAEMRGWASECGATDVIGDEQGAAFLATRVRGAVSPSPVRLAQ
jgi:type II secretory ATPase GspE/PulE/Tfp pilus assembly ATPase PilB-like protein